MSSKPTAAPKEFLVGSVFSKLKLSKGLMAGLLLGGTLGSFGVAAATSTPSTTVFYACLNVKAGTMNNISITKAPKCATGNINTSWNATGPKGDTGSQGVAGQQGLRGLQGLTGDTGLQGLKGDAGEQGAKGDTGTSAPSGGWYVFLSAADPTREPARTTCPDGTVTTHFLQASYWAVADGASVNSAWLCPY